MGVYVGKLPTYHAGDVIVSLDAQVSGGRTPALRMVHDHQESRRIDHERIWLCAQEASAQDGRLSCRAVGGHLGMSRQKLHNVTEEFLLPPVIAIANHIQAAWPGW